MSNNIHLHKNDLPEDLKLGNTIAVMANSWVLMSEEILCA